MSMLTLNTFARKYLLTFSREYHEMSETTTKLYSPVTVFINTSNDKIIVKKEADLYPAVYSIIDIIETEDGLIFKIIDSGGFDNGTIFLSNDRKFIIKISLLPERIYFK